MVFFRNKKIVSHKFSKGPQGSGPVAQEKAGLSDPTLGKGGELGGEADGNHYSFDL